MVGESLKLLCSDTALILSSEDYALSDTTLSLTCQSQKQEDALPWCRTLSLFCWGPYTFSTGRVPGALCFCSWPLVTVLLSSLKTYLLCTVPCLIYLCMQYLVLCFTQGRHQYLLHNKWTHAIIQLRCLQILICMCTDSTNGWKGKSE